MSVSTIATTSIRSVSNYFIYSQSYSPKIPSFPSLKLAAHSPTHLSPKLTCFLLYWDETFQHELQLHPSTSKWFTTHPIISLPVPERKLPHLLYKICSLIEIHPSSFQSPVPSVIPFCFVFYKSSKFLVSSLLHINILKYFPIIKWQEQQKVHLSPSFHYQTCQKNNPWILASLTLNHF